MNWFNWFQTYQRPHNTGVVDVPLRDTDYMAGSTSPIVYKERLTSGDWSDYIWDKILQWSRKDGKNYDCLGCTGFAVAAAIEAQIKFLTGKEVKVSRRWINKMSGCNQGALKGIGNYIYAPADWVRKNGWVLEEDYPTPDNWTTDEYYQDIPEPLNSKLLELAKLRAAPFINEKGEYGRYEFLDMTDPNIDKHLKHAPLGCTLPIHQVCGFKSPDLNMTFRDSYEPWDKQWPVDGFKYILKFIVELKGIESKIFGFKGSPELWVAYPMDSMQRLEKVKQGDLTWLDGYNLNENIITLPVKKP